MIKEHYIVPDWPAPAYVHAYATTRKGGYSFAPFDHFNLGEYVGDSDESLALNRAHLTKELQLPSQPVWVKQVHGTRAISLDRPLTQDFIIEADAIYTHSPDKVCSIRTADCIPLLLCSTKSRTVAAIHAGWRGLLGGIIQETIDALPEQAKDLLIWLGPAISQHHYEVDENFRIQFCTRNAHYSSAFIRNHNGRWQADLYAIARILLQAQGVPAHNIYGGDFCTYAQQDLFFSHRRDQVTGRMASLIWTSTGM